MITIEEIKTKPKQDIYQNIEGICTTTVFWLDPRDKTCGVRQDSKDNSTPMDEWNGFVLTWGVNTHPSESNMRQWIEENETLLSDICDGFESHWNGNNHVGQLSMEARSAYETIEIMLDNDSEPMNYYEFWSVESWLGSSRNEITADMTDEQLKEFADGCKETGEFIVSGDILEFITQIRDTLKFETEVDG